MAKEKIPPTERLASSFKLLAAATDELNVAADELNGVISTVETALKTIKIEVSAWYTISGHTDHNSGNYWSREVGYSRIGRDWSIAVKRTWGNLYDDEPGSEEVWKFADAPRWMCVEAVGKIPDLLDELIARSQKTTYELKAKTAEAQGLATLLKTMAEEVVQARKQVAK